MLLAPSPVAQGGVRAALRPFPNAVVAPAFVFLPEIARISVGKFEKIAFREQFVNWDWEQ